MDGGDGSEWDGTAAWEEEGEEEVEEEREEEIGGYGGEEEGPRGAPWVGVAPTEPYDWGVLREIVDEGMNRRRRLTHRDSEGDAVDRRGGVHIPSFSF